MTDISSLGIRIDSTEAKAAASDLDRLSSVGGKTETSIGRLIRAAKEFGSGLRSGAREGIREFTTGTNGVSAASRNAANDMGRVTRAAREQSRAFSLASSTIRRYVLLAASAFSAREIIQAADAYSSLTARLLLATGSSEKFSAAQAALSDIAHRTRSGLGETVDLFANLTRSTEALGVSQKDALAVTETINKAMAVSGTSAADAAGALVQLGQAFASGSLRGDELNSIMERSPRLARAIADGMGVSIGALRALGAEGKLTGEKVFTALQKSGEQVGKEFARLPMTVGGATTQVKNALLELIGEFSNGSGAGRVLAEAISDVAGYIRDLTRDIKSLAQDGTLQRWMDDAQDGFEKIVQLARVAIAGFQALDAATARWGDPTRGIREMWDSDVKRWNEAYEKSFREALDAFQNAYRDLGNLTIGDRARRRSAALVEEPPMDPDAPAVTGGPTKSAEQMRAAAQLRKTIRDAELAAIQTGLRELTGAYGAAEATMEAQRSAGLISEDEYYTKKRGFIRMHADAQVEALEAENQRLAAEKATGAERAKNQQRIADNESKIRTILLKATADTQILGMQQTEANRAVARSFEEARQSAQAYLDTIVQAQRRELSGMGLGQRSRNRDAGLTQIDDRYQGQRDELSNNRALLQMEGKWTAESERQYDARLAIINDFHAKARASYDEFWRYRSEREGDLILGIREGLNNYLDEARNVYQQAADAVGNAIRGMEDALVSFVTKGKADFRSLADAILADILRIQIRAAILGLFPGLGKAAPITASLPTTVIPGRASGGPVLAGRNYLVNERGPELLEMGGRNYLMMGSRSGNVVPNHQLGGGVTIHQTLNVGAGASRSELAAAMVIAKEEAKREIYESMRNGGVFA